MRSPRSITIQEIKRLNDLVDGQFILFDETGIMSTKDFLESEVGRLKSLINWHALYHDFLDDLSQRDVEVVDDQFNAHYFSVTGEKVILNQDTKLYILARFNNVTKLKQQSYELKRAENVQEVMLDIMKTIFTASTEQEIFKIALQSSVKAIHKSTYGTIMIKEGEYFIPLAHKGYIDNVMQFRLPCKESFLFLNTEGLMNRFVIVDQDKIIFNEDFIKDVTEGRRLKSIMTGPIYVDGELYGMFSIDSYESNAFDIKDLDILAYLARTTGYAIEHHRLYQNRQSLSK